MIPISNMSSSTAHSFGSTWHRRKRGIQNQAIGRSRGGLTTKIVALVDALGNLIRFVLLPGQRHDSKRGAAAVIPSKADQAGRIPHDAECTNGAI
ncbi:hypothetical protein AC628_08100 [Bradyrhizobium sp. NAS96.2]|nr:hypothetical protein AC628_08100 [Bradyrhizobium sp. NAS96.2]